MKKLSSLLLLSAVGFISTASAATIPFVSGFLGVDNFNIGAGQAVGNFTVASGTVDAISGTDAAYGYLCAGATGCVDLDGLTQGSVTASLSTVVGTSYTLTFTLGSAQRGTIASSTVTLGNLLNQTYTDPAPGVVSYTFIANSTTEVLTFASNTPGANGDILSHVMVNVTTPEPGTMVLLSLPLVAFGASRFRRNRA